MDGLAYWLLSRDRTDDEITLTQLAQACGLWHGTHETCPAHITGRLGRAAKYLAEFRAINYQSGGKSGRGSASWFGLPELAEGSFVDRASSAGERSLDARPDEERYARLAYPGSGEGTPDQLGKVRQTGADGYARLAYHPGRSREDPEQPSRARITGAVARRPDRRLKAPTVDEQARLKRWGALVDVVRFTLDEEDSSNAAAFVLDLLRSNVDDSDLAELLDKWGTELQIGPTPTAATITAEALERKQRNA